MERKFIKPIPTSLRVSSDELEEFKRIIKFGKAFIVRNLEVELNDTENLGLLRILENYFKNVYIYTDIENYTRSYNNLLKSKFYIYTSSLDKKLVSKWEAIKHKTFYVSDDPDTIKSLSILGVRFDNIYTTNKDLVNKFYLGGLIK